ncbi:MAG: glycosyl hydrolase [bacterium]|nr:glycosyl hydrolase [bacterium]
MSEPLVAIGASVAEIDATIARLLDELRLDEKVAMLSGHGFLEEIAAVEGKYCDDTYHVGAGNERLGIASFQFMDGPRGVGKGASTCFPVSMARGASFDVDLEERIGDAMGRELRAQGANLFGGVCINLLRHPAWGRAQETYGEDPVLLGEMGAALVRGVQRHNVVATPKHFAANSMENARFHVNVEVDERALREVYLPHFKRCIDEGALAVMSAYNRLNGSYCGHNEVLLTKILKHEWGFSGFAYSDFVLGCRGADACAAGLDVEAPDTIHYGSKLEDAVKAGEVSEARIDDAVTRVLRSLLAITSRADPQSYDESLVACADHISLAREAASKSIVLLENRDCLPWDERRLRQILVLGRLAAGPNLGDHGSSRVWPPYAVTPLEGLRRSVPEGVEVVYDPGEDVERVAARAAEADVVLVVVGYDHEGEGEFIPGQPGDPEGKQIGGDRQDLTLGSAQEQIVLAAARANPNTVVAVMAGSAVLMENWRREVAGLLYLFYPGMEGGAALADVLFGRVNPGGRLPFTIPERADDLPLFDRDASEITYDLWHGYTKLEREGLHPAYAFGSGSSYTHFTWADAEAVFVDGDEAIRAQVTVANTGERGGDVVVQVYAGPIGAGDEHPRKRLCGFARVSIEAGASQRVRVEVPQSRLAFFDSSAGHWALAARDWRIEIGASSSADDLLEVSLALPPRRWSIRER